MAEPMAREAQPLLVTFAWLLGLTLLAGVGKMFGWVNVSGDWLWGFGSAAGIVFLRTAIVQGRYREIRRWTKS